MIITGSVGFATDFVSMRIKGETAKGFEKAIHDLLDHFSQDEFDLVAVPGVNFWPIRPGNQSYLKSFRRHTKVYDEMPDNFILKMISKTD